MGIEEASSAFPAVSIVVPVYNEKECLAAFCLDLRTCLPSLNKSFEIIFVDDGSTDGGGQLLDELADTDDRVTVIHFRRNFGQTAALQAGFDHARGEIIVSLDGDGQNDPRDIPSLIAKLDEGYDLVNGWRRNRKDDFWKRRAPSLLGNRLISFLTGVRLNDFGCTLKAYRREVLQEISLYGEMHRMIPVLAHLMGARIAEIEVTHHTRAGGASKYNLSRALSVILDLITLKFFLGYFTRPLHFFGLVGIGSMLSGLAAFAIMVCMKVFQQVDMTGNPFMILGVMLLIVGAQLVMVGLLGEVTIRTYFESQNKSTYVIRSIRTRMK